MLIKLKDELGIFHSNVVELNEGLTIITGCNGSGKTTLSNELEEYCKKHKIEHSYLDANDMFHKSSLEYYYSPTGTPITPFRQATLLQKGFLSEHEFYEAMFSDFVSCVRPAGSIKKYFIIIDGLDSGGDIIYYQHHVELFKLILDDCKKRNIECYIVVTCNNFYYLSADILTGECIFLPDFRRASLPVYNRSEYCNYIRDINISKKNCIDN